MSSGEGDDMLKKIKYAVAAWLLEDYLAQQTANIIDLRDMGEETARSGMVLANEVDDLRERVDNLSKALDKVTPVFADVNAVIKEEVRDTLGRHLTSRMVREQIAGFNLAEIVGEVFEDKINQAIGDLVDDAPDLSEYLTAGVKDYFDRGNNLTDEIETVLRQRGDALAESFAASKTFVQAIARDDKFLKTLISSFASDLTYALQLVPAVKSGMGNDE